MAEGRAKCDRGESAGGATLFVSRPTAAAPSEEDFSFVSTEFSISSIHSWTESRSVEGRLMGRG